MDMSVPPKRLFEDVIAGPEFDEIKQRYAHLRHHFGWQYMVETTYYREQLEAQGETDWTRLFFGSQRAYETAHANDMSMRERQAHFGFDKLHIRNEPPTFTQDELRFLAEHFNGANDPTAADILGKVLMMLSLSHGQVRSREG